MFSQSPIDYMLFGKPESYKIERKEKKEEGTRKVKEDQAQREAERLRKLEADRKMRTGLKSGLIAQQYEHTNTLLQLCHNCGMPGDPSMCRYRQ